jgi:hypothetical protein
MLRTGCLLAAQGDFVMALRWSGLPFHRPPATTLLGHYADRTLTGKSITASRTHTTRRSAPLPRIGTLPLAVSAAWVLPYADRSNTRPITSRRGVPTFRTGA